MYLVYIYIYGKISHLNMFPRTSFAVGKIRDSIKESKNFTAEKF